EQELFLLRMINNFVYKNKWYVGGGGDFVMGDVENNTDMKVMKIKLLKYLKRQKTLKIKSVVFQKLAKNDFVDIEEVFL
ncbi:MAG: hypothetical protein WAT46_06415, partial [Saprospiraceae bacterium]